MSDNPLWAFPDEQQPRPQDWSFDLDAALASVVRVHADVPADAYTAETLGTDRVGSGVVIGDDGLVLTIGYLITEASAVWLTSAGGRVVPGHPLAYDQATGFGLILPLGKLEVPALPIGSASTLAAGDRVLLASHGGRRHALVTRVRSRQLFAGYWEYLLDEAIVTAPAHPQWGGAAMIDDEGRLVGIGSLLVPEAREGFSAESNVAVPIDLLVPIRDELVRHGQRLAAPRPWLGLYINDEEDQLRVAQVASGGPAERAGLRRGDLLIAIGGQRVHRLADFYRALWGTGDAGCEVLCTVARAGSPLTVRVVSGDRADLLKKPAMH
jgi:S1-C subfamily serine protease